MAAVAPPEVQRPADADAGIRTPVEGLQEEDSESEDDHEWSSNDYYPYDHHEHNYLQRSSDSEDAYPYWDASMPRIPDWAPVTILSHLRSLLVQTATRANPSMDPPHKCRKLPSARSTYPPSIPYRPGVLQTLCNQSREPTCTLVQPLRQESYHTRGPHCLLRLVQAPWVLQVPRVHLLMLWKWIAMALQMTPRLRRLSQPYTRPIHMLPRVPLLQALRALRQWVMAKPPPSSEAEPCPPTFI